MHNRTTLLALVFLLSGMLFALTAHDARLQAAASSSALPVEQCVGMPVGTPGCSVQSSSSSWTKPPHCGNGVLNADEGEECDKGIIFNGISECTSECRLLFCGDSIT
ncbi:MAG: hypothetical protein PHS73_03595, partial [Candidatus Peribacteraceae bacterium]|nr:hypothetical protein [Candidatus Peribacteraceae bacterium]